MKQFIKTLSIFWAIVSILFGLFLLVSSFGWGIFISLLVIGALWGVASEIAKR